MTDATEAKDVETTDGEQTRRSSHCSADFSDGPFDQPSSTRENAIEIAADLVRQVDCNHRPLACEAARKLKSLYDDNRRQVAKLRELYDDHKDMAETIERQNTIINGAEADEIKYYQQNVRAKSRRIDEQTDEIIAITNDMRELIAVCERAALAMAHFGVPDDGTHPLSEAMVHLRVVRTDKFEAYADDDCP